MKMNKIDILNNKIEEIENENSDTKGNIVRDIFIALGIGSGLAVSGFALGNLFTSLAYPLYSLATIIPSIITYDVAVRKNIVNENNKQISHLKNIGKKGIKKSKKLDEARLEKIEELRDIQAKKGKKDKIISISASLPITTWFISSGISFLIPEAFIASLASVAVLSGLMIASAKEEKEILKLDTRITNIENDLILEPIYGYTEKQSNQTIKSNERKKASPKIQKSDNETLVERYLKELEKGTKTTDSVGKAFKKEK